ncbi:hypothetical protein [Saccharopolyspora kobensis]|uniref:hypothetical protein n=1 Tax=Saccharopolyspora kobensis TaxID=146035 RepID=UPI000B84CF5B|nr:hypothetical protein [Saccharopolyspora kobensis]
MAATATRRTSLHPARSPSTTRCPVPASRNAAKEPPATAIDPAGRCADGGETSSARPDALSFQCSNPARAAASTCTSPVPVTSTDTSSRTSAPPSSVHLGASAKRRLTPPAEFFAATTIRPPGTTAAPGGPTCVTCSAARGAPSAVHGSPFTRTKMSPV